MTRHSAPLADRLMRRVEYDTNGGCWLWTGSASAAGYGHLKTRGRTIGAHKASLIAFRGVDVGKFFVLHRCDVPQCINPDHLFLGTHQDNMDDRAAKGRCARQDGERGPGAKLTAADVIAIRQAAAAKTHTQKSLAAIYGLTQSGISRIMTGSSWKPEAFQ